MWKLRVNENKQTEYTKKLIEEIPVGNVQRCCSNHSSLKDKWFHNKQSSPMGYQVKSGELQENSTRNPRCIAPLYILLYCGLCYNNMFTSCPITHPHVFSLRPPCFLHVPWHHTFNLRSICAHHMYPIMNLYSLTSSLTLTPSRLF